MTIFLFLNICSIYFVRSALYKLIFGRHDTQHNDTQHNDTKHKGLIQGIQHNDSQYNDTKHNNTHS